MRRKGVVSRFAFPDVDQSISALHWDSRQEPVRPISTPKMRSLLLHLDNYITVLPQSRVDPFSAVMFPIIGFCRFAHTDHHEDSNIPSYPTMTVRYAGYNVVPNSSFEADQTHSGFSDGEDEWLGQQRNAKSQARLCIVIKAKVTENIGLLLVAASQAFFSLMNVSVKQLNSIDPPVPALQVRELLMITEIVSDDEKLVDVRMVR